MRKVKMAVAVLVMAVAFAAGVGPAAAGVSDDFFSKCHNAGGYVETYQVGGIVVAHCAGLT